MPDSSAEGICVECPGLKFCLDLSCEAAGKIEQRITPGPHVLHCTLACSGCCHIKGKGLIYTGNWAFNTHTQRWPMHTYCAPAFARSEKKKKKKKHVSLLIQARSFTGLESGPLGPVFKSWICAAVHQLATGSPPPPQLPASSFPFLHQCHPSRVGAEAAAILDWRQRLGGGGFKREKKRRNRHLLCLYLSLCNSSKALFVSFRWDCWISHFTRNPRLYARVGNRPGLCEQRSRRNTESNY